MKAKLFILLIVTAFLFSGCYQAKNDTKSEDSEETLITQDEMPPLRVVTIDKGRLKMNQDGNSIGNDTELTELQKQLRNDTCDVIEIVWIWDSSPKYPDMPMKINYNKLKGELKLIYTQNNVVEAYSNINPNCLSEFLKNGEKSFYSIENYCKDSKYDFDSGDNIQKEAGEKPQQDEITGSVRVVKDYIKENAHDASSVKFIEWTKVSPAGKYWIVRCKYKGANALGGTVTENAWFYIQNNMVVETKRVD
ncbi:hypothetical protein [Limibacterium fermenti]|uniref:hypothetical protein n=1 Tax=Limibacterium fermenti TaxID=3229863 RepID=UPI000E8BD6CA|nr:hypothetical protein [Porphyromonadaceae bacterium]